MNDTTSVGFVVAFFAGLVSFLSPCVLPLVPSYLSFITGLSLDDVATRRWVAARHALLFIAGFTLIFLVLGAAATGVGRLLNYHRVWIERIGGLLIILFGLYLLGVFRWGWLTQERRVHLQDKPLGYLGSALVGIAFGAGWTPCIGPILGSILAFTAAQSSLGEGLLLLGAYSMGLAVPFLLAALAVDRFLEWFQRFRRYLPLATRISGAILVLVGLLLTTGYFAMLAAYLQRMTPDFIRSRL